MTSSTLAPPLTSLAAPWQGETHFLLLQLFIWALKEGPIHMPRFTSYEIGEELLELNDNSSKVNQIQGHLHQNFWFSTLFPQAFKLKCIIRGRFFDIKSEIHLLSMMCYHLCNSFRGLSPKKLMFIYSLIIWVNRDRRMSATYSYLLVPLQCHIEIFNLYTSPSKFFHSWNNSWFCLFFSFLQLLRWPLPYKLEKKRIEH